MARLRDLKPHGLRVPEDSGGAGCGDWSEGRCLDLQGLGSPLLWRPNDRVSGPRHLCHRQGSPPQDHGASLQMWSWLVPMEPHQVACGLSQWAAAHCKLGPLEQLAVCTFLDGGGVGELSFGEGLRSPSWCRRELGHLVEDGMPAGGSSSDGIRGCLK